MMLSHGRIVLGVAAFSLVALLSGLGLWQLERREWKLALIERVETRIHATPVAAPDTWNPAEDEYRPVTVTGRFQHEKETLTHAVTRKGQGYWVLTPLLTDKGNTVLINRGFVPTDRNPPAARAEGQVEGETTITGLLRISEPEGGFLRHNLPSEDRWYSRDVQAIATAKGLGGTAPYFIDADGAANPGGYPIGGLTVITFRNDHLTYALTWFALAGMVAGAGFFALREKSV